jgi:sugar O-acyltransferase (sialic acid O-acetyltransferase NeuD family)
MTPGLLLVAASGLARETLAAVAASGSHEVIGVLDDDPGRWGSELDGALVLGGLDMAAAHPEAQLVLCAGKGSTRAAIAERLGAPEARYATVVHPAAAVAASCRVGAGSILLAGCVLTAGVDVGRHVVAMPNVVMTHDTVIGDFATLCAGVVLGGSVRIGARAYIGMSTSIRQDLSVGADALVGMGSVVVGDVPAAETWFGAPAARRQRASELIVGRRTA